MSSEKPSIDTQNEKQIEEMGDEQFRINIENEIYKLSLDHAQIEAAAVVVDVDETNNPEEINNLAADDDEKLGESLGTENHAVVDGWGMQDATENHAAVVNQGWGAHDTENHAIIDGWGTQDTDNHNNQVVVDDGWGLQETANHVVANDGWGENTNGDGNGFNLGNETENVVGYGENVVDEFEEGGSGNLESLNNNRRKSNYPMRPGADDCAYYVKFGTCKFGLNCKFNHPPRRKNQGIRERVKPREENSERTGQTECKYQMTSGGCKFGNACKFNHGSENSSISQTPGLNFLGLPIRLGQRECPYYMRTGSCKYGSSCRFHHPEPTTVGGSDPGHGNGRSLPPPQIHSSSSWSSSPRAYSGTTSFPPTMYPPTQGVAPPNPGWNGYKAGTYQTSERGLPTPPAFAVNNLPTQINLALPLHQCMVVDEYPERPDEPECSFFMKTGDCKYKSSCKFHHPKNRKAKAKSNSYSLSEKGLPLRPGQPICAHYHQYGICKYGPACKYDHPSNIAVSSTLFS